MGVWQGVAMDSLKLHPVPPCLTLLCPARGPPQPLTAVSAVACPQSGWPAAVLHPFGHPTMYAYGFFPSASKQARVLLGGRGDGGTGAWSKVFSGQPRPPPSMPSELPAPGQPLGRPPGREIYNNQNGKPWRVLQHLTNIGGIMDSPDPQIKYGPASKSPFLCLLRICCLCVL
jgi:hypothetical protein